MNIQIELDRWDEPPLTTTCRAYVPAGSLQLACVLHDDAPPGRRDLACGLWPAHLCAVCARQTAIVLHPDLWHVVCYRCRTIDAAIGTASGARQATPVVCGTDPRGTLLGRRPGVDAHAAGLALAAHAAAEVAALERTYTGERTGTGTGTHATERKERRPSALGRPLLDDWLLHAPPSAAASGAAYARYVSGAHPWLVELEPRSTDVTWLTSIAAQATFHGRWAA